MEGKMMSRIPIQQHGVNRANQITIKKSQYHDPNVIIATVNAQSIRTKELQLSDLIRDHALDRLVVMETWLNNKDKIWCDATGLNSLGNLYFRNRTKGKGGGLMLVCNPSIKVMTLHKGETQSFEYVTWLLTVKSRHITLTGVYHPPYSNKNKITNSMFPDDFTEFTTNVLSQHTNNIILGDFNLYVSKDDNIDAAIFTDTCEAIGLYQHVSFATHKSGNVLDFIIIDNKW